MKGLLAVIAVIAAISMWACGIGVAVSVIALVLKWCGLGLVSSMSAWLPLKFIDGWIVSFGVTLVSAAIALN